MEKLMVIDSCMREGSRTRRILASDPFEWPLFLLQSGPYPYYSLHQELLIVAEFISGFCFSKDAGKAVLKVNLSFSHSVHLSLPVQAHNRTLQAPD